MLDGNIWIINTYEKLQNCFRKLEEEFVEHKHLVVKRETGKKSRSLSQNSLFHVWAREYAAHHHNKPIKEVIDEEVEGMKRLLKVNCYIENAWVFMVIGLIHPVTKEVKKEFKSTKDYGQGEMFQFMEWVQMKAAEDGVILESTGEYQELK